MTELSVDLLEKFKTEHGFDLGDLEYVCRLLSDCGSKLYGSLRAEEKEGRGVSEELSIQIEWIAYELVEGAEHLELTLTDLRAAIR